jgi:hypothetical protein
MLNEHRSGYWSFCLSLLLCLISPGVHADQKTGALVVPIEDKSGPGSPLQISGHVSFVETVIANKVTSSRSENVKARNISDKPILLLVASLEDAGPKSSGEDFDLVVDNFFKEKAMLPGEDVTLLQRPFGEHYTSEPFRSTSSEERPPKAQFHLGFVQFSDGSTFGDSAAARKWLDSRESTLVYLKKLRQQYYEQGEPALLQALKVTPAAAQSDSLWNEIRELQRTSGTQATVTLIDHVLSVALQHATGLVRSR